MVQRFSDITIMFAGLWLVCEVSDVSRVRVRASISGTSPRDSTFRRTTGSVLEVRRLKRSKTGHAFIKERMRKEDAIYGGEMSAHHYFRDFAYCDSGMIPWLLVAELRAGIFFEECFCQQADNVVALNKLPFFVKQETAVKIAIKSNAHIRAVFDDRIAGVVAAFLFQMLGGITDFYRSFARAFLDLSSLFLLLAPYPQWGKGRSDIATR